jgi:hypothetical protein
MRRIHQLLLAFVLLSAAMASCDWGKRTFSCTKRPGDWGLYQEWSEAPALIACFGGMALSADDERLCRAALKVLDADAAAARLPGDPEPPPHRFFCSVFP